MHFDVDISQSATGCFAIIFCKLMHYKITSIHISGILLSNLKIRFNMHIYISWFHMLFVTFSSLFLSISFCKFPQSSLSEIFFYFILTTTIVFCFHKR